MKAKVIIERAADGGFWSYLKEDIPNCGISGFGETAEACKADFLTAYDLLKSSNNADGIMTPDLQFEWEYDMQSFFNCFDYLNVSKVGEKAGINPSLMRQYASGSAKAGEKQYGKLRKAVNEMVKELSSACF